MTDTPARSEQLMNSVACACARDDARDHVATHSCAFPRVFAALASMLLTLLVGGCVERKRPAVRWQTASLVHPRIPQHLAATGDTAEPELEDPVELQLVLPAPPPLNATVRPPRPRVATPQPVAAEPSKPQTPFVAPQLSVAESRTAQADTNASLAAAEHGIEAARGKTLNAAQTDMASKINGFMANARTAAANGDWTSAQTLARKAQLLSEELAKSLQP
jgi:hypothetical protein